MFERMHSMWGKEVQVEEGLIISKIRDTDVRDITKAIER